MPDSSTRLRITALKLLARMPHYLVRDIADLRARLHRAQHDLGIAD